MKSDGNNKLTVQQAMLNGVIVLETFVPDWIDYVNEYSLDMHNPFRCILAQIERKKFKSVHCLIGGHVKVPYAAMSHWLYTKDGAQVPSVVTMAECGFDSPWDATNGYNKYPFTHDDLNEVWKEYIAKRKAEKNDQVG